MIMRFITISVTTMLLAACSSNLNNKPPAGYSRPIVLSNSDIYLIKQDPVHYQGKKDLVQIKVVTSLHNEDQVNNVKFRSISATHVYDCRKKNKYMEVPDGFFSDKYAIGSPVIPYPEVIKSWLIAKDNTLNNFLWASMCHISMPTESTKSY